MKGLSERISEVLYTYRLDALYYIEGSYYTKDEVEQIQIGQLKEYVSNFPPYNSIALYGWGGVLPVVV